MTSSSRACRILLPALALTLAGCVSLGKDPPDSLLNLTPASQAAAGTGASGTSDTALAILDLQAPQKLNVTRVPVTTGDSSLAYLKDGPLRRGPAIGRQPGQYSALRSDRARRRGGARRGRRGAQPGRQPGGGPGCGVGGVSISRTAANDSRSATRRRYQQAYSSA